MGPVRKQQAERNTTGQYYWPGTAERLERIRFVFVCVFLR
jgi:hypothetical protein